jgi:hypothetical protein
VSQRTSAAVDVDFVVRHIELFHQGHGHHGKGFVDFPQVHIGHRPTGFGQGFLGSTHGRSGKPFWLLRVGGVADDARQRCATEFFGGALAHQDHGGCAIVDGRAAGGGDGSVFFEGGFERGNFVELDFAGAFVNGHHGFARTGFDGDGGDFGGECAALGGGFGALHAGGGKGVLFGAAEVVFGSAVFAKGAHAAAWLVGVFQAVEHHVVKNFVVAESVTATAFEHQVGRVGHALHAAGHQHVVRAGHQHVVRKHGGSHARATHFGQRHRACAFGQTAFETRLARRRLALASHQAVAKQDFGYPLGADACALHGSANGGSAQIVRGQAGKVALKTAHGRACGADDDDGV